MNAIVNFSTKRRFLRKMKKRMLTIREEQKCLVI